MGAQKNSICLVGVAMLLCIVCAPRLLKGLTRTAPPRASAGQPKPPARVASVALASDSILLRLLGTERLAAVSWVVDWPEHSPHAGQVPAFVPRLSGEPEAIVALQPDLAVVADHSSPGLAAALRAAGVATLELATPRSLDAVLSDVERVGNRVGAAMQAREWSRELRARIDAVEEHARRRPRWRTLIVDSGYAQGLGTLADDLLTRLNTVNPACQPDLQGSVPLDAERLLAWQPQVVFLAVSGPHAGADARASLAQIPGHALLQSSNEWSPLRVVGVGTPYLGSVSPLAVDALEAMDRVLEELRQ
jgi:iron complex transport system substrate-binding protein